MALLKLAANGRDADGMEASSKLVMRLNGTDATDGMFDLIFGRNQGKTPLLATSACAC